MKKAWVITVKSISFLVLVFLFHVLAYAALLICWEFPVAPGDELLDLYLPTAISLVILVAMNRFAIGWVWRNIHFFPGLLASVFMSTFSFYAIWWVLLPGSHDYRKCDFYTKQMNGGIHWFQGKSYKIEICGLNGIIQPENFPDDEVRLRVVSMDGELLAERFFSPLLAMGEPVAPLTYGNGFLAYGTKDQGPEKTLRMPPSWLDGLRAGLPRLWR